VPSIGGWGVGVTPGAGTAVDGKAVGTAVGGTGVEVAGIVGEGGVVSIRVRVGSAAPQPNASPISERTANADV
jgi:hypothetical protein